MVSVLSKALPVLSLCLSIMISAQEESSANHGGGRSPAIINLGQQKHNMGDLIFRKKTRNAVFTSQRWQNGIIYYEIRSPYTREEREKIASAMRLIEQYTCVRFIPRTNQDDYLYIVNTNDGCYSTEVGKAGGPQEISLQSTASATCISLPIILHELLHAAGLWHEHARFDRDSYVTIRWENVRPGLETQFRTIAPSYSSVYNLPYDYYSVMHYDAFAFGNKGGVTMEPKDGRFLRLIGKVNGASTTDFEKLRRIYGCSTTQPRGVGADAGFDPFCKDNSADCPGYKHLCGLWPVVNNLCKRSCQRCTTSWDGRWRRIKDQGSSLLQNENSTVIP